LHTGFFGFTPKPTGLVCSSTALKFVLAFSLPIAPFRAVAPVLGYGIYFGLLGWSIWFMQKKEKGRRKICGGVICYECTPADS
jgi:hypothetical protein